MTHPETGAPYSNWNEDSMTDGVLMNNPQLANDNEIDEKTKAVYIQFQLNGELGSFPVSTVIGVRYEQTDVESTSTIAIPSALVWEANNDFSVRLSPDVQPFSEKADYDYVLPSLDFSVGLTDTLKGRVSFGQTIARAPSNPTQTKPTARTVRAERSVRAPPATRRTRH
jgi:outer membrane receptor protein involved in Fe transport